MAPLAAPLGMAVCVALWVGVESFLWPHSAGVGGLRCTAGRRGGSFLCPGSANMAPCCAGSVRGIFPSTAPPKHSDLCCATGRREGWFRRPHRTSETISCWRRTGARITPSDVLPKNGGLCCALDWLGWLSVDSTARAWQPCVGIEAERGIVPLVALLKHGGLCCALDPLKVSFRWARGSWPRGSEGRLLRCLACGAVKGGHSSAVERL